MFNIKQPCTDKVWVTALFQWTSVFISYFLNSKNRGFHINHTSHYLYSQYRLDYSQKEIVTDIYSNLGPFCIDLLMATPNFSCTKRCRFPPEVAVDSIKSPSMFYQYLQILPPEKYNVSNKWVQIQSHTRIYFPFSIHWNSHLLLL